MARTGARLIGSYETVRLLEQAGVPVEQMICVGGGERIDFGNGVFVSVFPSLHSCLWTGTHTAGAGDVCLGDLGVTWQERAARMKELTNRMSSSLDKTAIEHLITAAPAHSDRGDGGALVFLFETPEGSLLFRTHPGIGVVSWDPSTQTSQSLPQREGRTSTESRSRVRWLHSSSRKRSLSVHGRVLLAHHDNWLPGFSSAPDPEPIRIAFRESVPEVELLEPGYLAATRIFEGLPS